MKNDRITLDYLRRCVRLDPETGALYWLARPRSHFATQQSWSRFNGKFAGTRADLGRYPLNGYRRVRITVDGLKVDVSAHRAVFALLHGVWPEQEVDHIDGDRDNNRPSNLRPADRTLNLLNRSATAGRALPTGVSLTGSPARPYRARIRRHGKVASLGTYVTPEEASEAYQQAKRELIAFISVSLGEQLHQGRRRASSPGACRWTGAAAHQA